jgi:hypothetical protein
MCLLFCLLNTYLMIFLTGYHLMMFLLHLVALKLLMLRWQCLLAQVQMSCFHGQASNL